MQCGLSSNAELCQRLVLLPIVIMGSHSKCYVFIRGVRWTIYLTRTAMGGEMKEKEDPSDEGMGRRFSWSSKYCKFASQGIIHS
jgi:hypothetical protein